MNGCIAGLSRLTHVSMPRLEKKMPALTRGAGVTRGWDTPLAAFGKSVTAYRSLSELVRLVALNGRPSPQREPRSNAVAGNGSVDEGEIAVRLVVPRRSAGECAVARCGAVDDECVRRVDECANGDGSDAAGRRRLGIQGSGTAKLERGECHAERAANVSMSDVNRGMVNAVEPSSSGKGLASDARRIGARDDAQP